ncbi:MAG: TolC family protein [Akkermansia sp.]
MKTTLFYSAGIGLIIALSSCARYQSSPVDLTQEERGWMRQSASIHRSQTLKLPQARQIGLMLNPDLNKARLKLAMSSDVERQAGWWNDPSFSWDTKRVLQQEGDTINLDGGLAFTIPVTGLPLLEKQVASHYKEADYWGLRQAEIDFLVSLEQKWSEWSLAQQRKELIVTRLESLRQEDQQLTSLHQIGELDSVSRQIALQRLNNALRELQSASEAELEQKMALSQLLGLHPSVVDHYRLISASKTVPSLIASPSPDQLLYSPKILSQLASYAASETQFKAEIRKQYPELELGPAYTRDDGERSLGGGISFNIPLWNRNRKAIAESKGNRNLVRMETIQLWHGLLQDSRLASREQDMLHSHCMAEWQRLDRFTDQLKKLEQLHKMGETSLSDLAEARQQVFESKLAFLDSLNKLTKIQAQLRYLTTPTLPKN